MISDPKTLHNVCFDARLWDALIASLSPTSPCCPEFERIETILGIERFFTSANVAFSGLHSFSQRPYHGDGNYYGTKRFHVTQRLHEKIISEFFRNVQDAPGGAENTVVTLTNDNYVSGEITAIFLYRGFQT